MGLDAEGFLRPTVANTLAVPFDDKSEAALFRRTCPGLGLSAPLSEGNSRHHETFGRYVAAWSGWAEDEQIRFEGSSGGVLTALSIWLLESKTVTSVTGSAASKSAPNRTVSVQIISREEALASAGSRYAPVGNAAFVNATDRHAAMVGKPCEVSAVSRFQVAGGHFLNEGPLLLSFFCAGTPSQRATDKLSESMGVAVDDLDDLRYRGRGWPGLFRVRSKEGQVREITYDESWGKHLGRDLQWRCKTCVDGTGGDADIAVGDFWKADSKGFPLFEDGDGNSVIIARSERGRKVLELAQAAGIVHLDPIDLDEVAAIQPLQVERKRTVIGRLMGRKLAGKRVPRYRGYGIWRLAATYLRQNIRASIGTFRRTLFP